MIEKEDAPNKGQETLETKSASSLHRREVIKGTLGMGMIMSMGSMVGSTGEVMVAQEELLSQTSSVMGVMDGVLNVRDFGARGDGVTNDREAIQEAIDQSQSVLHPGGAVIYFPEGSYLVKGGSLLLRRLATFNQLGGPRMLLFKGAGWLVSTIINGNPEIPDAPLFIPDQDPANIHSPIGYGFEDLHLGDGTNNQEVFAWELLPFQPEGRSRLEAFFHRVIFSSRRNLVGPERYLVRLRGASRTRFLNCLFYGIGFDSPSSFGRDYHGGAAVKVLQSGGVTLTDCHTLFAGAMLDVEDSGEILVLNSRSDGGMGRPAWKCVRSHNITLINPANEGRAENPSTFYFKQCRDVVLINPQFATPGPLEEVGGLKRYPDVLQFEDCENCRVIGGHITHVKGAHIKGMSEIEGSDGTARLIRVKNNTDVSRYIVGESVPSVTNPAEKDIHIDAGAQFCCFELWGQHPDVNRVVKVGDCMTRLAAVGSGLIPASQIATVVDDDRVGPESHITVTLNGDPGRGRVVSWVKNRHADSSPGFTVVLNLPALRDIPFTYFIVN